MGLAEAIALILALFIPTTLFIVGYYFFARSVDPFRRKERKAAQPINIQIDNSSSAAQVATLERQISKLYRKGDKFAAFELYKQAYSVNFAEAEEKVEGLMKRN